MRVHLTDIRLTLCCVAIVLLGAPGGCARTSPFVDSAGTPLVSPHLMPSTTGAVLCMYRPFKFGSGLASPLVLVDGHPKVLMHNSGYTCIAVSSGKHSISTAYSQQWVEGEVSTIELEVEPDQSYYVQVVAKTRMFLIFGTGTDFSVQQETAETAEKVLKELQYLKPME